MSVDQFFQTRIWRAAWGCFCRLFILAGLSLLAWGLDDLAGFFANPARLSLVLLVTVYALIVAGLDYLTPPQPERGERHDPSHWHAHISEGIYILVAYGDRRDILTWTDNPALRWAGLAVFLVGIAISLWANITWDRYLRRAPEHASEDSVLISEGPFRFIRYPGLVALIFYCLGSSLVFRSWVGLALLIPLLGSILTRANELERSFAERYSHMWPMRTRASKRLIPFVY